MTIAVDIKPQNKQTNTLALPFFIGSSLFLQVTMGSKFGKIGQGSAELATLERLKNLYRLIVREMLLAL